MSEEEKERRFYKRYRVSWLGRVAIPGDAVYSGRVKDISLGGLFIELASISIPKNTPVLLEFRPYHRGKTFTLRAKGKVTFIAVLSNNRGVGHGIQFTHIEDVIGSSPLS